MLQLWNRIVKGTTVEFVFLPKNKGVCNKSDRKFYVLITFPCKAIAS